MFYVIAGSE